MATKKNRKAVPAVYEVDLSDKVMDQAKDDNNLARTRVNGFNAEVERLHRKYSEVEKKNAKLQHGMHQLEKENSALSRHLTRRTRALWTGFVAVEAKAVYCMSTDSWLTDTWWANTAQAGAGLAIAAYLVWPNLRNLIRLSRDLGMGTTESPDQR